MDRTEETRLVLQAQAGDRGAYAALVRAFWPRVQRWALCLSADRHLAEDLTQDAFLKGWSNLASFQAGTCFRSWLFRIVRNAFIDQKRGPRGLPSRVLPLDLEAREPGPVEALAADELRQRLESACAELPVELRTAFVLRTQEELSYAAIAEVMGATEETVRWRVFKARRQLLQVLAAAESKTHEL